MLLKHTPQRKQINELLFHLFIDIHIEWKLHWSDFALYFFGSVIDRLWYIRKTFSDLLHNEGFNNLVLVEF